MDILIAQIQADLRSNDALRQSGALLQALQQSAAGRDVSAVAKSTCEEIIASPASAVSKKLAFDLLRSLNRLTPDLWDTVCTGVRSDLDFPDPDVTAAAVSILSAIPSYRLAKLIADANKEISKCFDSPSDNLRFSITETLGCILARDDLVLLCENSVSLLDRVTNWWSRIGNNMLDRSDNVSKIAFESIGRLFQEFETKRMSRLAGDKLIDSENSLAIRSNWVVSAIDFVWKKRNVLIARSLVIPVESFRVTVFPLVYAAKAVASGSVEVFRKLSKAGKSNVEENVASAEKVVGVSDVVSHLLPFLSSLDPPLIFEVGINMLSLADVPGGKPEWASASIIAILTLWDRQEFSSARENIVRAVVTNLHLLDLHMQVQLFKRLLLMVRNLRAESDRMHALACICRTALCVDLFAKESVRRGQKPLPGTDIASLFEDVRIKDDLNSVTSKSLFREELVASLVESCFQLSLPLPEQKTSGTESRVIGALAYGTGYGALNWTEPALEVVEVCKPCVIWDCDGRTYAIDCYLKLLVRLCHIYDTRGGVKTVKDGASQDQILNETRLRNSQLQLIRYLREVHTPRICARLVWAIAEHLDLEGLDPLLADDPEDPLNIIVSNIHKVLFSTDSSATASNRLQDVQAVLLCAQRVGSRNPRACQLLTKELEDFRSSTSADSVNKHQARYILQTIKYVTSHPESRWAGVGDTTGDYPFSHHKLTVQFFEAAAAQDRKLEGLVHKAIQELWRPEPNELSLLLTKGSDSTYLKVPPKAITLTGSSDPCYVEGYHLADSIDGRITLHLKILNLTELELNRVDIRVGLTGALYYMDGSPQAVRQLRNLVSQDPVLSSVTVGVSHFERCALWVQVLYYPFYGSSTADYEGDYAEEDPQIMRQKRTLKPELGEPVILRCQPYKIPLTDLLLPHKCSPVEYFRLWPSLPAILECTGTYTYEGSGFKATAAQQSDNSIPAPAAALTSLIPKHFRFCNMGKSGKKSDNKVAAAAPASAGKPSKKGKREAVDALEKIISAKKQKTEVKAKKKKAPPPKKFQSSSEDDSSSDSEEEEVAAKVSVSSKKLTNIAKNNTAPVSKRKHEPNDSSDSNSSSDDEPKKAAAAKKPTAATLQKKHVSNDSSSESDSEEEDVPHPVNANKLAMRSAKKDSSSEEEDEEEEEEEEESSDDSDVEPQKKKKKVQTPVHSNVGKSDKKVTQNDSSSREDDNSDEGSEDSSEDEQPVKMSKKAADVKMKDAPSGKHEPKTPSQNQPSGSTTLFVGNLSFDVGKDDISQFFEKAAEVVDVRLATADDGSFRGFGHVEFATAADAQKARELNGQTLLGRAVKLDFAREKGANTPQTGRENNSYQKSGQSQGQTIFVKGFDKSLEEDDIRSSLQDHFGTCGQITRVSIPKDYESGASKGIAYIDFSDQKSASQALELSGSDLGGYSLTVDEAKPRGDSRDGGRGGGRRDGGGRGGRGGRFGGRGRGRDGGGRGGRGRGGRGGRGRNY